MKLGQEFYPLKSLRSNQKYGVFLKKPRNWVNLREYSHPIQTATYPPFTKGTCSCYYPVRLGLRTFCLRLRVRLRFELSELRIVVCGYGRGYDRVAPRLHQPVCGYGQGHDRLHPRWRQPVCGDKWGYMPFHRLMLVSQTMDDWDET